MEYSMGFDFGNSEICATIGNKSLSIPTAFAYTQLSTLKNLDVDAAIIRLDDDQDYQIGDSALYSRNDAVWHGRGDASRYASRYALMGLLYMASRLVDTTKPITLHVVTGLPAHIYLKNAQLRNDIRMALDGVHRFSLDGGDTWRKITVQIITVLMEGAGALILYGDKSVSGPQAVIDIGGRTTDLYVSQSGRPVPELIRGKSLGVESVAMKVSDAFEDKYDRSLSYFEQRQILHAYASDNKYPEIFVVGRPVPSPEIDRIVSQAVHSVSRDIASFVSSAFAEDKGIVGSSFQYLILCGGGAFYFYKVLKTLIPHLKRVSEPSSANSAGYYYFAEFKRNQSKAAM